MSTLPVCTIMPRPENEYYGPIITFLQWYISKGESKADVLLRYEMHRKLPKVEGPIIESLYAQAFKNARASSKLRLTHPVKYRQPDGTLSTTRPENYKGNR